jgi:hypothetical protein
MYRNSWLALSGSLILVGCTFTPQTVSIHDPRVLPLLRAASTFNRAAYGFTPLPIAGDVQLELNTPWESYDAMLHIYGKTSRTIAFRKRANGYAWIGEQETFEGPKRFESPDGTFNEEIVLTYEIEPVSISGGSLDRLYVSYAGDDPRLVSRGTLTLADVRPILAEWGYQPPNPGSETQPAD